jgi:hypothetical protein
MVRLKIRQIIEVKFLPIGITLLCMLPGHLFRLAFGDKGSSVARGCDHRTKLILEEDNHLIKVWPGFSDRWS